MILIPRPCQIILRHILCNKQDDVVEIKKFAFIQVLSL